MAIIAASGLAAARLWLMLAASRRNAGRGMPRVRSRRLPVIGTSGDSGAPRRSIVVAGRTYEIVDADGANGRRETCPWCLGTLVPGEDEIVRCPHPHCRQAGHRQHVEKFGCGGLCGLLG